MIDRATVDKIMNAANIVDVVSEFVSLRKSGSSYVGLCPFHDDRTPSLSVSPSKGVYKCFSCGKAGHVVKFIMDHEQLPYNEALMWLARKYHIEVRERELTEEEKRERSERESMFIVNEWALKFFHDTMLNTEEGKNIGLQYFYQRGFRADIIERFKLGFSPSGRHAFADAALKAGYQEDFLLKTGLCYRRDNGSLVDRYHNRVIFPWIGVSGKVTAFGGRLLDVRTKGVVQKYVNSPDSVIYHKSQELYGLFQSKKAIVKEDRVFMVEGYTDVISMHQCGIENVVANSGTALSVEQIKLLRRFTRNITLLYDGDEAGIHAAMRGTDMLLKEGMNIKVLVLPDGEDPDSFARKHSAEELKSYLDAHQTDFMAFKTAMLLKGVTDPIKRSEAINNIILSISVIPDPVVRDTYVKECALQMNMAEATIIMQMNKFIREDKAQQQREYERKKEQEVREPQPVKTQSAAVRTGHVERLLAEIIVKHGQEMLVEGVENPEDGSVYDFTVSQYVYHDLLSDGLAFESPMYDTILQEAFGHSTDADFHPDTYFAHHPDPAVSEFASSVLIEPFRLSATLQIRDDSETLLKKVRHLLLDFRLDYVEKKLKALRLELKSHAGDAEAMMRLMQEIKETQNLRNIIAKHNGNNIIT